MPNEVELIRYWHRQRCFAMERRKREDLALGAFLRLALGWSRNKPEAERNKIAKQAAVLAKKPPKDSEWFDIIEASRAARAPVKKIETRALKEMEKIAKTLPTWEAFAKDVRGFGAASLAVIVGEAGDLSNYDDHSKLWKRMGLAVLDGVRQGGLAKGAGADAWIEHGYSPVRRSRMWNIGDTMIKGNRDGQYRTAYLDRKAYELARDPEMKPIKAHRRAQRYMEKRLLKHLWQAWRRAVENMAERPSSCLPADAPQGAGEAILPLPSLANQEMPPHHIYAEEIHQFSEEFFDAPVTPMRGFFAGLSAEQKKKALEYRGEEFAPRPNVEGFIVQHTTKGDAA